jgi:hypothetical protein
MSMGKQHGFRGKTGNPDIEYVYSENESGISSAAGLNRDDLMVIAVHNQPNISTNASFPQLTIRPPSSVIILNNAPVGNINFITDGTGDIVLDASDIIVFENLSNGVMQTDTMGVVSATKGTDGQLLISSSTGTPIWANVTSNDGTVEITEGPNSLDLSIPGTVAGEQAYLAQCGNATSPQGKDHPTFYLNYLRGTFINALQDSRMRIIYDDDSNIYIGDSANAPATFTAHATGYYFFNNQTEVLWDGGGAYEIYTYIITPTSTYKAQCTQSNQGASVVAGSLAVMGRINVIIPLNVGDVVTFKVVGNPVFPTRNSAVELPNGNLTVRLSWISGFRIS